MKVVKASNYQSAYAVLTGRWLRINTIESTFDRDEENGQILPSKIESPEKTLLKKEAFELLSAEAKEIINTILNGPEEILDLFASPVEKKINKRRITKYYCDQWNSKLIVNSVIAEIKEWTQNLK